MNVIRPDHKILRALLEEDEGFKIELKSNIIRSALKGETIKTLGGDVKRAVQEEAEKVRDELLISNGWKKGKWSWTPTQEMRDLIKEQIVGIVRAEIDNQMSEIIPEIKQWIADSIKGSIEETINKGVKEKLEVIAKGLVA